MKVTVVNGEAGVGDRVAYATREGNRAVIRLGIVTEVVEGALRVAVEHETPYYWKRSEGPRIVRNLDRVVVV